MSRPVSELEAQVLSNKARAVAQARLELLNTSPGLPALIFWMVPGLVALAMGDYFQRSLGVTIDMVRLLAFFAVGGGLLAHRVVLLERRVQALTQLVRQQDD